MFACWESHQELTMPSIRPRGRSFCPIQRQALQIVQSLPICQETALLWQTIRNSVDFRSEPALLAAVQRELESSETICRVIQPSSFVIQSSIRQPVMECSSK